MFDNARGYIMDLFGGDASGHDFYHSIRVHDTAVAIQRSEGGDIDIIRLAALLHDADDRKLFDSADYDNARRFMDDNGIPEDMQERVVRIISEVSFRGRDSVVPGTLEGRIVQDADRLDAIGAVGIGRAFAYGGSRGRPMHVPGSVSVEDMDAETYYSHEGTTIDHFHEKLLLLKDMMNTDTARRIAEGRHRFMEVFLEEFHAEWDGLRRGHRFRKSTSRRNRFLSGCRFPHHVSRCQSFRCGGCHRFRSGGVRRSRHREDNLPFRWIR